MRTKYVESRYTELEIREGEYFLNVVAKRKYDAKQNFLRWWQPVNPLKMTDIPVEVNGHYVKWYNKITIPAGLLQWPFYDTRAPSAVNYGALGMAVGHELSHSVDNSNGKDYDVIGKNKTAKFIFL